MGSGLREGWEILKLGEVCEVQRGLTYSKKDTVDFSKTIVLRATNINLEKNCLNLFQLKYLRDSFLIRDNFKLKKGSLLICFSSGSKSHLGKIALVDKDYNFAFGGFIGQINPNKKITSKYLFYNLISSKYKNYISKLTDGIGINNLKLKDLQEFSILLPPLQEQEKIVTILDEAFSAIAKAKANAELNLQNVKELFESFLQGVFENKGEGWEEDSIKNLTELVTKGSSPNWQGINYVDDGGIFFLTSKNVGEGKLLLKNKKYLEEKFNDIQKTSILKKGDVLTNIVGASIGRTAIYDLDEITNINQAVCLMRCLPEKIYNYYLMYLLNSPFFKNILHDNEVNNARANLSLTFFKNLVIPLPKLSEQNKIVKKINTLQDQTKKLESIYTKKLQDLEELKESILQKAFNGELT